MRPTPGAPSPSTPSIVPEIWSANQLIHELRGPIQALAEASERLGQHVQGNRNRKLTTQLQALIVRLSGILTAAEGITTQRTACPADLVEAIVAELRRPYPTRVIEVRCDTTTRSEMILDTVALSQGVANLVGNALHHAKSSPVRVYLRLEKKPEAHLQLVVEDDGPGIGLNQRRRAFVAGWRGKNSARHHPEGKGLGLALVHRLTHAAHGSIRLGTSPKGGCRFEILLPLQLLTPLETLPLRVAIIEDDADCRDALQRLLTKLGCVAWEEFPKKNLLQRLQNQRVDVLILDQQWGTSRQAGAALAQRLRMTNWVGGLILWTGNAAKPDPHFDSILAKPTTRQELAGALRDAQEARDGRKKIRRSLSEKFAGEFKTLVTTRGKNALGALAHRWLGVLQLAGWGAVAQQASALEKACLTQGAAAITRRRQTLINGLRTLRVLSV